MGQDATRQPILQPAEPGLVYRPFQALNQLVAKLAPVPPRVTPPPPAAPGPAPDNAELFLDAVADVTPLDARSRDRVASPAPAIPGRAVTSSDAEALAELCDLVTGNAPFDISDSDEYIEGAAVGLDPRLLRRLGAGEYAYQAHIDLHGMTSDEARAAVAAFLVQAYHGGKRCVLIIHGRGRNSKDQIPVLKSRLTSWLARGENARRILAFTSARACDGGTGALYVLLRRDRRSKRPIRVTLGAKR